MKLLLNMYTRETDFAFATVSDTQESLFMSFDSSVTVLRSNRRIWIGIHFCEEVLTDTESSPFSSPIITISHHLWGISPFVQTWSESKLFCCFTMVFSIFIGFCSGPALDFPFLLSHQFRNENICLKANTGWLAIKNMIVFVLNLAYFDIFMRSYIIVGLGIPKWIAFVKWIFVLWFL